MKLNLNQEKFLDKEKDIKHKDIVEFVTEGEWTESRRYKKEDGTPSNQFDINIKLANGEIRSTSLGWNNLKLLGEAWGDETSSWIGKQVRAWKTKSERAKTGFIFVFAPISWDRDDTGEWIVPEGERKSEEQSLEESAPDEDDIIVD